MMLESENDGYDNPRWAMWQNTISCIAGVIASLGAIYHIVMIASNRLGSLSSQSMFYIVWLPGSIGFVAGVTGWFLSKQKRRRAFIGALMSVAASAIPIVYLWIYAYLALDH